jgi:hypothetical protein
MIICSQIWTQIIDTCTHMRMSMNVDECQWISGVIFTR